MEIVMDGAKYAEEPAWLEEDVRGVLRVWQIIFICFGAVTSIIVMVCCCFRFRIPRTKQQIEADYQRRKITGKFRQQLEAIQDTKITAMSLQDALELLHKQAMQSNSNDAAGSQPCSTPHQQQGEGQTSQQEPMTKFAKFAGKIVNISKLAPNSPTSPTPSADVKMNF